MPTFETTIKDVDVLYLRFDGSGRCTKARITTDGKTCVVSGTPDEVRQACYAAMQEVLGDAFNLNRSSSS